MTDAMDAAEKKPTAKWWHVSWKRVAIALFCVFAFLLCVDGAVSLVLYQFGPLYSAHEFSRIEPRVNLVPADLPDKNLALLQGARIDCQGLSMTAPSSEIRYEKHWESVCALSFKNGWNILISDKSKTLDLARILRSDSRIAGIYGRETLSSNYALTTASMQVTPDEMKWWRPHSQNARIASCLQSS